MPDSGTIALIAGQVSELFLSSRQDKKKMVIYLELALSPGANVFECSSKIIIKKPMVH